MKRVTLWLSLLLISEGQEDPQWCRQWEVCCWFLSALRWNQHGLTNLFTILEEQTFWNIKYLMECLSWMTVHSVVRISKGNLKFSLNFWWHRNIEGKKDPRSWEKYDRKWNI